MSCWEESGCNVPETADLGMMDTEAPVSTRYLMPFWRSETKKSLRESIAEELTGLADSFGGDCRPLLSFLKL